MILSTPLVTGRAHEPRALDSGAPEAPKVAIVTGAGSGIGRAVSIALARIGFSVVAAGRRRDSLEETVVEGDGASGRIVPVTADVRDPSSVDSLFETTAGTFERVDCLINNAGRGMAPTPLEDISYQDWRDVLDTCVTGTLLCTQRAFRLMKVQRPQGGRIINNGSVSAHVPRPMAAAYTSAKHGVTGLTRATSLDGRPFNIACGQIDIGNAATSMSEGLTERALQADGSERSEPRMDIDYVARAFVFMATLPLDVNIQFMTLLATQMPYIGRG